MKMTTLDLKQDRQWRATVGISKEQFFILLNCFKKAYFETYQSELNKRKVEKKLTIALKAKKTYYSLLCLVLSRV